MKKISVIVPIFNVEKYLKKCLNSIVEQTYKNIEIILVDDGSTDSSGKICDEYEKKYNNIKVIHKKNGGLSSARNSGLDLASGDYISFIDSDDYIDKEMYSVMVNAIKKTDKDIASCGRIVNIYDTHQNIEFSLSKEKEFSKKEAIIQVLHLTEIDVSACDKLYKRQIFDNIRYPEGKISEDAAVIFEILHISNGVVHVGKPYYHYVFRKKSISKSEYSEKNFDVMLNLKNTECFIDENYIDLKNDFKLYACISVIPQIILICKNNKTKNKYKKQYDEYLKYFNGGYKILINSENLTNKVKFSAFSIKHKMILLYLISKKIYQFKYILKSKIFGGKNEKKNKI